MATSASRGSDDSAPAVIGLGIGDWIQHDASSCTNAVQRLALVDTQVVARKVTDGADERCAAATCERITVMAPQQALLQSTQASERPCCLCSCSQRQQRRAASLSCWQMASSSSVPLSVRSLRLLSQVSISPCASIEAAVKRAADSRASTREPAASTAARDLLPSPTTHTQQIQCTKTSG